MLCLYNWHAMPINSLFELPTKFLGWMKLMCAKSLYCLHNKTIPRQFSLCSSHSYVHVLHTQISKTRSYFPRPIN